MINPVAASPKTEESLRKRINFVQQVLVVLLVVVIAVPFVAGWWIRQQYPAISTVSIDNVQIIGSTDLCPGDALTFSYVFHATGAGVLIRDATARYVEPPKTIIFSSSRRFILEGPVDEYVVEAWHVPTTFLDPETDTMAPIPTGRYVRYFAISSPSRSTVVAIGSVPFTVKEECD